MQGAEPFGPRERQLQGPHAGMDLHVPHPESWPEPLQQNELGWGGPEVGSELGTGFLHLSAVIVIGTRKFSAVGGCPLHCGTFCNIPGFYPVDASNLPELW